MVTQRYLEKSKTLIIQRIILPIAIYGPETGSLTQLDTKKLNAFENNCPHVIFNVRLQNCASINEIEKQAKQQNPIENVTQK